MSKTGSLKPYVKPGLAKHENIRGLTAECSGWQCSVSVPSWLESAINQVKTKI